MQRDAAKGRIGQRIVITDDDIDWFPRGGFRLWECAEFTIELGKFYMYGNERIFDLHELRWNFREREPGQAHNMYNYAIWIKNQGWLHPAYDYQGVALNDK